MLEVVLSNAERNHNFLKIFFVGFVLSFFVGFMNSFLGSISIFLVAFISLALSYPLTKYLREIEKINPDKILDKSFFKRYEAEIGVFWALFVGIVLGMYMLNLFGLTADFSYEENFVNSLKGEITGFENGLFFQIFFNNLFVAFNTFLISTLFFSGLIFVIVWNASILAYYLYSLNSHSSALIAGLNVFVHALLEIGGYVWAGLLGAILSYRLSIYFLGYGGFSNTNRKKVLNKSFAFDCFILLCLSVGFIFLGALIEVL
jgi:uncharacterized membrane protein SpoIIM required for sporulation